MPNFSQDFQAIGFDADHCLVKYNVLEISKMLIKKSLMDLHENEGWPKEILEFDTESSDIQACLNYSLFDIDRGLVIKLGEDKEILAAMKGRRNMSQQEIEEAYGTKNPRYEAIQWPKMASFPEEAGPSYWSFCTYFDSYKVP